MKASAAIIKGLFGEFAKGLGFVLITEMGAEGRNIRHYLLPVLICYKVIWCYPYLR